MRLHATPMAGGRSALRREVLALVVLVLVLHGVFIALYLAAGRAAPAPAVARAVTPRRLVTLSAARFHKTIE